MTILACIDNVVPTIRILVADHGELARFARSLSALATGKVARVVLIVLGDNALHLHAIRMSSADQDAWLRLDRAGDGGVVVAWSLSREGWMEAYELLSPLRPGTFQYLSGDGADAARLVVEMR